MSVFLADEQSEELDLAFTPRASPSWSSPTRDTPADTEVTILLVDEDEMASYNERFLSRTGPTDVLAFPVEDMIAGSRPRSGLQAAHR